MAILAWPGDHAADMTHSGGSTGSCWFVPARRHADTATPTR